MDLSINSNLSFKSRSAAIRKADDFARKVKNTVPLLSSTKMYRLNSHKKRPWVTENLDGDILYVRYCLRESCLYTGEESDSNILKPILEYKAGNCFESSVLGLMAAKANGIKNCRIAHFQNKDGQSIDHAFILVDCEKPYIIDTYFGFADYIPEAIKKYKSEYNIFKVEDYANLKIVSNNYLLAKLLNMIDSQTAKKEVETLCPQLILK